jgi:antitoxin Phd
MVVTATEMKNHFGQCLEEAIQKPVFIQKTGRSVAVMLSMKEYERLESMEDAFWAQKAMAGEKSGYIGKKESSNLLKSR